ncbi:coadhesin-like [Ylistrum balloti]|uniref:coadhesin-like n=1 Tax=Ylistrum balloti TaxID=509963 RepID=UPI002905C858|nr:coadhesin-like [Ylistrum balloti]
MIVLAYRFPDTNSCLPSDCKNGAICKYKCICKGDYFGTHCENLNGGFSEWGSYGSCSRTCGTGSKTRTRACDDPTPVGTGSDCSGNTSETIPCSTDPCPILCPNASTSFRNNMTNMTSEELMKVIDMLKAELKVDKTKTSLSVRRKTSAKDSRTSAKTIGAVGAVMLAVPFVLIILLDLNSLYQYRSQKSAKRQISPQI